MAISYSRKTLGQTGDGHFSPVGAYSEKDDMVRCPVACSRLTAQYLLARYF